MYNNPYCNSYSADQIRSDNKTRKFKYRTSLSSPSRYSYFLLDYNSRTEFLNLFSRCTPWSRSVTSSTLFLRWRHVIYVLQCITNTTQRRVICILNRLYLYQWQTKVLRHLLPHLTFWNMFHVPLYEASHIPVQNHYPRIQITLDNGYIQHLSMRYRQNYVTFVPLSPHLPMLTAWSLFKMIILNILLVASLVTLAHTKTSSKLK